MHVDACTKAKVSGLQQCSIRASYPIVPECNNSPYPTEALETRARGRQHPDRHAAEEVRVAKIDTSIIFEQTISADIAHSIQRQFRLCILFLIVQ